MIYFHHIGGTGGRSIIVAFLSQFGDPDQPMSEKFGAYFHQNTRIVLGGRVFARNQVASSDLFFGSSHQPIYECTIPNKALRFTVLRDPIRRYLTFYRRYVAAQIIGRDSGPWWKGNNVIETMKQIPKSKVLTQLWMFSPHYNVKQAYRNIRNLAYHFRCKDMAHGLRTLERLTCVKPLPIYNIRTHFDATLGWARKLSWWIVQEELSIPGVYSALREFFAPEYQLMEMLYGTPYSNYNVPPSRTYAPSVERAPWEIPS